MRYARRPQWLGIEWAAGGPPALYVTPARDALAAALLDAAQVHIPKRLCGLQLPVLTRSMTKRQRCVGRPPATSLLPRCSTPARSAAL